MATTNPLTELIPAKARKYVYGIVLLAALVFSAWQASQGDIEAFVGGLIAALVNGLALSNTPTPEKRRPAEVADSDLL